MDAGILWSSMAKNITRPKEAFPLFFPFSDERRLLTKFDKKNELKLLKFTYRRESIQEQPRRQLSAPRDLELSHRRYFIFVDSISCPLKRSNYFLHH